MGKDLTPDLVERLGGGDAVVGGGRVFVGRDTRGSGPGARGGARARRRLGRRQRGPRRRAADAAVALLALDLGASSPASHNPPEYNGVKFFDRDGSKLSDADEEAIEALLDAEPARGGGEVDRRRVATDSYLDARRRALRLDLTGLRIAVDCANGAYSTIAPEAFERSAPR